MSPIRCIRCHREKGPGDKGWTLIGEEGDERCNGCSTPAERLEALKAEGEALSWEIRALRTYGGADHAG